MIDIPFAVAGGIRTRDQAAACLEAGADKVSINSPALERPELIDELARDFGSQCVVLGVDSFAAGRRLFGQAIYRQRRRDAATPAGARSTGCARRPSAAPARSCSTACAATASAPATTSPTSRAVVDAVTVPVIASGGAGAPEHFRDVFAGRRERRARRDRLPRPADRHPRPEGVSRPMRDRNAPLSRGRHRRARLGEDGRAAARHRPGRGDRGRC